MTPTPSSPPPPRRILLVQLRRLGDVLLSTPLLADLRRAFPAARIDYLVGRAAAPLVEGEPNASEVLVYDDRRLVGELRRLRARGYDWVIDLQSNPRTAQIALLSGARVRAGWGIRGIWRFAYTHRLPRGGRPPEYVPRERQRMLEMLGVPIEPARPRLRLTAAERAEGETLVRGLGVVPGTPLVGLTLGTGDESKNWPPERYAELSRRLRASGIATIVLETPGDAARVAAFRDAGADAFVVPLPGLRRFLAVLARCDVFICGDSGPSHMATALDVPAITLTGPTNPANWSARLPTTLPIRRNAGCPACAEGRGAKRAGHDCMGRISVDDVEQGVRALLRAGASRAAPAAEGGRA